MTTPRSTRTSCNKRRGSRLSSHHPLAAALARRAAKRVPYPGAVEEPGRGVRALIDGVEARLGSAAFCGLGDAATQAAARSRRLLHRLFPWRTHRGRSRSGKACGPTPLAVMQALARARIRSDDPLRRPAGRGRARSRSASASTQWLAAVTPAEKIAFIELLKSQGRRVLMVGDGLNDAPALAAAHASLSPITAAHLTQAQADALFLGDRLAPVLRAVIVARQGALADAAESRARRRSTTRSPCRSRWPAWSRR